MMAKTSNVEQTKTKSQVDQEVDLRGTLFSVMILGIIIIVSWIGAFSLFISRS